MLNAQVKGDGICVNWLSLNIVAKIAKRYEVGVAGGVTLTLCFSAGLTMVRLLSALAKVSTKATVANSFGLLPDISYYANFFSRFLCKHTYRYYLSPAIIIYLPAQRYNPGNNDHTF